MSQLAPAPGQISFFQADQPALNAGAYQLSVEQTMGNLDLRQTPFPFTQTIAFTIDGTRFSLTPDQLSGVFPPAGVPGQWSDTLPMVILNAPSLPWERTLTGAAPSDDSQPTPWLALLTVTPDDLGILSSATPTAVTTVADLITPGSGIAGPDLGSLDSTTSARSITTIDLPVSLFNAIAPTVDDLPLLAHVRAVNTDGRAELGVSESGTCSVVTGNRFPQADATNFMFLVSLEGVYKALAQASTLDPPTAVRLAVLTWWRVVATAQTASFLDTIQALPHRGGVGLLALDGSGTSDAAAATLALGYSPVTWAMRSGETTTAWYRGPCVPVTVTASATAPYLTADQALHYDPATGMFDASLAAAFEIGRLSALAAPEFLRALYDWRNDTIRAALAAAGNQPAAARTALANASPSDLPAPPAPLLDWLAALVRLEGLPFAYIIPAAELLPPESLRFFLIDQNWLKRLAGGALGVGLADDTATLHYLATYEATVLQTLRQAVSGQAPPGTSAATSSSTTATTDPLPPITGLLLRSQLVSSFPTMKVAACAADGTALTCIRMERLSASVLFVLYLGVPETVTFSEPPETLQFGVVSSGDSSQIFLRGLGWDDTPAGSELSQAPSITPTLRPSTAYPGVLDVSATANALCSALQTRSALPDGPSTLNSAQFAIQMVRSAGEQAFSWPSPSPSSGNTGAP